MIQYNCLETFKTIGFDVGLLFAKKILIYISYVRFSRNTVFLKFSFVLLLKEAISWSIFQIAWIARPAKDF